MRHKNACAAIAAALVVGLLTPELEAQTMPGMSAMENTIGSLSSGTAVEPKTTSESESMIRASLADGR
jgi:hypothetical protein